MSSNNNHKGTFITLEGPEGAGKTTQLKLLSKFLQDEGIEHVITRDPGGTSLGKPIRRLLLNAESVVSPVAELLLYEADRAQNVSEVIMPGLAEGKVVFCDRYVDSTIAYQGFGRGIDLDLIEQLNNVASQGLKPKCTILFDIESSAGLARLHPSGHDRLEREALEFHQKVRNGYLELAKKDDTRWRVLDASMPMHMVQEQLRKFVMEALN
ncbi:MAG: dTMP kinase [Candidatus Obscuribacterales bacterium]|jgi:dTMP kinase|nr:dTMP kinase [Candidatus Obscuribacterales bacterium]